MLFRRAKLPLIQGHQLTRPHGRHLEIRRHTAVTGACIDGGVDGSALVERPEGGDGWIAVLRTRQQKVHETA